MAPMTDDVLRDLTVSDGSCRDVNLFGVTRAGAERLLAWITSQFDSHVGDAYPSRDQVQPIEAANFAGPMDAGYSVRGIWERGSTLFDQLQYYVVPEHEGDGFVELTFFPQDIHLAGTVAPLTTWLQNALTVATASGVMVRFENASFDPTWARRDDREVIIAIGSEGER
ncbi:MAG: hypothetical protein IPK13_28175 [Deltaproteobacteria bacterium]|nr:hypothetical protein [Deltaproteobacteria bacterium]